MPHKHGWGYRLVRQVCDLALKSEVKKLILYHGPDRSDQDLAKIEYDTQRLRKQKDPRISCTVAYEGVSLRR